MKKSQKYRQLIADSRRIVIKIGSRVLVQENGRFNMPRMRRIVKEIADIRKQGHEVVIVTSGAIGAGMDALRLRERPTTLPDLQMAAAVGQTKLMARYDDLFSKNRCQVGQILLTHADFHQKIRMTNARRTMDKLISTGIIPVVNENDVVADEEIKADLAVGDNDLLAALLVNLIRADLLIMLTTVDGVMERKDSGRTARIKYIETIDRKTLQLATGTSSRLSKGGMITKLKAARAVSKTGCSVIIANGCKKDTLARVMKGDDVGTLILM